MAEIVERPKPFSDAAKGIAKRIFRHENTPLIGALAMLIVIFGFITKGITVSRINMTNVLVQSSIRGVAAVGQAFVILTANIDLSVAGVGLFSVMLGSMLMTNRLDENLVGFAVPLLAGIPIMVLTGIAWGALSGSLVSRVGVPALIVTLGVWRITYGAAYFLSEGRVIGELPASLAFFGQGRIAGVPVPIIIFMTVVIIGYFVLNYTTFGRSIYAVGGNPVNAGLCGINVENIKFRVFAISGFLCGVAAVIMLGRVMSGTMRVMQRLEMDTIASVTIGGVSLMGGRGNLIGVIMGVLIIGVINNGMSILGAGPGEMGIVTGAVIISAVTIDYIRRR